MKQAALFTSVPNWAKRFLSQDPAEKTWICQRCGEIAPLHFAQGWYARRRCMCEHHAEALRQRQSLTRTQSQILIQAQRAQTYRWLGATWAANDLQEKTLVTFERERQPHAYDQVHAFALNPQGNLVLFGSYGVGKTHLLAALANLRRAADRACLFASAVTFFDAIGERIGNHQEYHGFLKQALQTPLLLLDDSDKPKPSEFRQELFSQIIEGRTRRGLPLALSSNGAPSELERYVGGAALSRLMMGLIPIQMSGFDYRLEAHR